MVKLCPFILKILSGNEILISIKGHNSVTNKNYVYQSQFRSCQFIYKIWWNSIGLFSSYWAETKLWHESMAITLLQTGNNPNLDLVNFKTHTKFGQILSISSSDIEWKRILNEIWISVKDHNSVTNVNTMCNNPNLDLVIINAHTKFGKIISIFFQAIMRKRNYDRRNEGWTDG